MRLKCGEIMTRDPVCCSPGDTAKKAAELMKAEDVGPLPVVETESGRLIGIVNRPGSSSEYSGVGTRCIHHQSIRGNDS